MNNTNKIVILGFLILGVFFLSFICFLNDNVNYAIVLITILFLLLIYFVYLIVRKNDAESIYIRKIKRILKVYNSDIVYLENDYNFTDLDVLKVKDFKDIIKAYEQLNNPIMFLSEEKTSVFLIKTDNELLYYVFYKNNGDQSPFEEKINNYLQLINENKLTKDIDKDTIVKLNNNKIYKIILIKK